MKTVASLLTVVVIGINLFFVAVFIQQLPAHWAIYLTMAIVVTLYMAFVVYLVSQMLHVELIHRHIPHNGHLCYTLHGLCCYLVSQLYMFS